MNILITTSRLSGGVATYFRVIRKYLSVSVDFLEIGAQKEKETIFRKFFNIMADRKSLREILSSDTARHDLIHINPSFSDRALIRDGTLLLMAKRYGKKTLVFFRGWNERYVDLVDRFFFRSFFFLLCHLLSL